MVPFVRHDCGGASELIACGCSLGAFHAANFALKRADLFPLAICLSGNYDPSSWDGWVESADFDRLLVDTVRATYPKHEHERFVAHLRGLVGQWVCEQGRTPVWATRASR